MPNHRAVNAEQEKVVVQLHREGHCVGVIARTLGVKYKTMLDTVKRLGLTPTRHSRRSGVSLAQIQEMVAAYSTGEGTKSIAARYNLKDATIARYLRASGVEIRAAGFQKGDAHVGWVGGRIINSSGYAMVRVYPDDPFFCMASERAEGPATPQSIGS
jgi:hypothetical protein